MLNRSALILRYREPAVLWINGADPEGHPMTLEEVNADRTVYLVPDEVAATPKKARRWLRNNYLRFFEWELEGWYTDDSLWPVELTMELFDEWFIPEFHELIMDTVGGRIVDDEA